MTAWFDKLTGFEVKPEFEPPIEVFCLFTFEARDIAPSPCSSRENQTGGMLSYALESTSLKF